jgi:hypothetical protein
MSPTGKAGRPRNSAPVLNGKTQHDRFVETAKALEVDESGKAFERAMKVIAPPLKAKKPPARKAAQK